MTRDLGTLADSRFDLLIIGGGIYGAVAAWDATLRGLDVALVERADFGGATSANSLKIVHGGLRHLQQANLKRMRESIRERAALLRIAPHLVRPLPFLVATHGRAKSGRAALGLAMKIADLVGFDRNRGLQADRAIPAGRLVSRRRCLEIFPGLEEPGLTGAAVWYEGQLQSSERLTLSFLLSAAERGAVLANYAEAESLLIEGRTVTGATMIDRQAGERFRVRSKVVLNAAGPWADELMRRSGSGRAASPPPALALGINLVRRGRIGDFAIGIRSKTPASRDPVCGGNRYLFLTPWKGSTLIGTSYRPLAGAPPDPQASDGDLQALLDECNTACPALDLSMRDVSSYHRGLVPLKGESERGRAEALAEEARLVDHEVRDGLRGVLSMNGIKYTTARGVAEKAVDAVVAKLDRAPAPCRTATSPVYGGETDPPGPPGKERETPAAVRRRLTENHGSRAGALAREFAANAGWCDPIVPGAEVLTGEVVHAVRGEMACSLADVVFRRTGMGAESCPSMPELEAAARLVARELGWNSERQRDELDDTVRGYLPLRPQAVEARRA